MSEKNLEYHTDGRIIVSKDGGCMGIFSAVSILNDNFVKIKDLEAELEEAKKVIGELESDRELARKVIKDLFLICERSNDCEHEFNYFKNQWREFLKKNGGKI